MIVTKGRNLIIVSWLKGHFFLARGKVGSHNPERRVLRRIGGHTWELCFWNFHLAWVW